MWESWEWGRQANSRGLLYESLEGLTDSKELLKRREIPNDLGEIPILLS